MSAHAYQVGQTVLVLTTVMPRRWEACTILALMPEEYGDHHYRVQSAASAQQRMVAESQISLPQ